MECGQVDEAGKVFEAHIACEPIFHELGKAAYLPRSKSTTMGDLRLMRNIRQRQQTNEPQCEVISCESAYAITCSLPHPPSKMEDSFVFESCTMPKSKIKATDT